MVSNNQEMKMRLMTALIAKNFRDKKLLAEMTERMSERELKKVFTHKGEATLALIDRDLCVPLLDALRKAALIKDYEFREDGKVFVTIQRSVNENDE